MEVERAIRTPAREGRPAPPIERALRLTYGRGRRQRIPGGAAEILLAAVVATLVSGLAQIAVGLLDIPMPSHMPTAIAAAISLFILLGLAGLLFGNRNGWSFPATAGAWTALAALTTVALALPLQATEYYLGGISMDQSFRTQYLTRLTDSALLLDMNYVDTAPYYPAGWFWLGGRFANLVGLEGWEAYKPWSLLSMAVVSTVSFSLWSRVALRPTAALLALTTALVGLGIGAVEPYAWVVAGLLPPVSVIAFKMFSSGLQPGPALSPKRYNGELIGCGVFLGMAGAVYTLHFGFASLVFAALATAALLLGTRRSGKIRAVFAVLGLRLLVIGIVALPFVLVVWTPYLVQAFSEGWPGAGAALRYLPEDGASLPVPMLELSVLGVLSLIGAGWLVLRSQTDDTARALGMLVVVCYAWYILSALLLAADTTLLPWRLLVPLTVALASAGVLGALEAVRAVLPRVPVDARRSVILAVSLLGLIGAISVAQSVPQLHEVALAAAHRDYYPTGTNALGEEDRRHAGPWYPVLHETIAAQTGKEPRELVVLSDHYGLLTSHPYWGFQQPTPHYANPLGDYDGRLAEIEAWAEAPNSEEFVTRLDTSPYRAPDVFILSERSDGYQITLTRDAFPKHPNVERFAVTFDKGLFSNDHFSRSDIGPFVVLVRR